jgi:hypothetical protein
MFFTAHQGRFQPADNVFGKLRRRRSHADKGDLRPSGKISPPICAAASLIAASRSIPGELPFVSAAADPLLAHPIRTIIKGMTQKTIFLITLYSLLFSVCSKNSTFGTTSNNEPRPKKPL